MNSEQVLQPEPRPVVAGGDLDAPTTGDCVEALAQIQADVAAVDRMALRIVETVQWALAASACETVEGLPVELWLTSVCRVPGGEAWFYRQAADVLRHLPATHLLCSPTSPAGPAAG